MKMKKLSEDHYIVVNDSNKEMHTIPTSQAKEIIGEVDVEKKAKEYYQKNLLSPYHGDTTKQDYIDIAVFFYNQALEDNKEKKWTDEDVIKIVEKSRQTGLTAEYIILSLKPQTEWEVEFIDGKLRLKQ